MLASHHTLSRFAALQVSDSGAAAPGPATAGPGASPGPVVGTAGPGSREVAPRVRDGKTMDASDPSGGKAPLLRAQHQDASPSEAKSLDKRRAHNTALTHHGQSLRTTPAAPRSQAMASSSDQGYGEATTALEAFFQRERNSLSPGVVRSIDHYFSYGEFGIAHSVIAEIVQRRAAVSAENVGISLQSAAARVLNDFD